MTMMTRAELSALYSKRAKLIQDIRKAEWRFDRQPTMAAATSLQAMRVALGAMESTIAEYLPLVREAEQAEAEFQAYLDSITEGIDFESVG